MYWPDTSSHGSMGDRHRLMEVTIKELAAATGKLKLDKAPDGFPNIAVRAAESRSWNSKSVVPGRNIFSKFMEKTKPGSTPEALQDAWRTVEQKSSIGGSYDLNSIQKRSEQKEVGETAPVKRH